MNVFELSAFASPLLGAIAGGMAVKTPGPAWTAVGVGSGLVVGLALYFASMGFTALMFRVQGVSTKAEKLGPFQWLASMAGVLVPMASPFAAWGLSSVVVGRMMHL